MKTTTIRNGRSRDTLFGRQRELQKDVHRRILQGRTERPTDVRDEVERSNASMSGDVELALLQMQAETLQRVDEALGRLDAGEYGCCFDCGGHIGVTRMRALPFAVRCTACAEKHEHGETQTRHLAQHSRDLLWQG